MISYKPGGIERKGDVSEDFSLGPNQPKSWLMIYLSTVACEPETRQHPAVSCFFLSSPLPGFGSGVITMRGGWITQCRGEDWAKVTISHSSPRKICHCWNLELTSQSQSYRFIFLVSETFFWECEVLKERWISHKNDKVSKKRKNIIRILSKFL